MNRSADSQTVGRLSVSRPVDDGPMGLRWGRADLHIHTVASDGTANVQEILAWVEAETDLDVIAITDHERIDAALAARAIARAHDMRVQVVVGEEVTTRGGHLLALFIEERIVPLRSLRSTIVEIHAQGGLAIPAHPLFPYPMCASARMLHRLLNDPEVGVHPDALETFNPTTFGRPVHDRVVAFATEVGLAGTGGSDAHDLRAIGAAWTSFPGRSPAELRTSIMTGACQPGGAFHPTVGQLPTFGRQLRKYGRDLRDEVRGRLGRERTGRHLGYPGGHLRPPRFDEAAYRRALAASAGASASEVAEAGETRRGRAER